MGDQDELDEEEILMMEDVLEDEDSKKEVFEGDGGGESDISIISIGDGGGIGDKGSPKIGSEILIVIGRLIGCKLFIRWRSSTDSCVILEVKGLGQNGDTGIVGLGRTVVDVEVAEEEIEVYEVWIMLAFFWMDEGVFAGAAGIGRS